MNDQITGIVSSKPRPAAGDGKDITFTLLCEDNSEVSCVSSVRFDHSTKIDQGDKITLFGSRQPAIFLFEGVRYHKTHH